MDISKYPQITIQEIVRESERTRTFVFKSNQIIKYRAGQFITLLFSEKAEGRRAYSFSSSPEVDRAPAITVSRVANGFVSRRLTDQLKVGDRISYTHISGNFTLPETIAETRHFVFFAAGGGITPIFSLIKSLLAVHHKCSLTLIYSSHSEADALFAKELKKLQQQYSFRFKIEWIFSVAAHKMQRRLSHFLLLQFIETYVCDAGSTLFYLCGPYEYMDMIQIVLRTEGIAPQQIRQEHFYIPRLTQPPEPPDIAERTITLRLGGKEHRFRSGYPNSILASALAHNIPLDFSCRSGQCGSCVAKCLEGTVWMRYNEILTDEDLEKGLVLTCNGFPIGGAVILEK
ncbi:MAG TPA: iron-sulfur cluster-binding domain-containing protein [Edaphocola sp.]|nr:iron-sulfur cluster-binding domain-containing protein [Edaphocola sp.]